MKNGCEKKNDEENLARKSRSEIKKKKKKWVQSLKIRSG